MLPERDQEGPPPQPVPSDLKEFTYWLHKLRIKLWDPARVASDTRKAIRRLDQLEQGKNENRPTFPDFPQK